MTKNDDVSWMPVRVGRVSLKGFSTAELVAELATREEVNVYDDDSFQYLVDHYPSGPCKILVVRE